MFEGVPFQVTRGYVNRSSIGDFMITKARRCDFGRKINEVAIGPVTGRTLYSYRSGSHVLFYVHSLLLLFLSFSIVLWCRPFSSRSYISISCSVFYGKTSS